MSFYIFDNKGCGFGLEGIINCPEILNNNKIMLEFDDLL